ncbi:MAG: NAD(P)H-dependent oxidoreductase [Actinomycetota bacterium]
MSRFDVLGRGRPTRLLVVSCHPCADGLLPAARRRLLDGLGSGADRVEVRHTDLYAEDFDPDLTSTEHRSHTTPGVAPELQRHADDLRWCDTLVLVYPTWWSGQPAIMKGWIDRVWAAGVAWELPEGADRLAPRLQNVRRIVVVTTHGSTKLMNAAQGESGKRVAFRSLRAMCHPLTRCHWWAFYGVDVRDESDRRAWLDDVESRARQLVR